ncbi:AAA family ATPase [Patescibacteria group bacterium]|nr:AAA family ATPase [Patescibacteria group bacterium]MBU1663093.1 AAA family ATPase [Patescibacteria group bacterium]MBU1934054.1 AAA family ATPase [Patescibacteria group bacterium]MBU2263899.1 AAA family ATPase [Patescibacteria group bacterium]
MNQDLIQYLQKQILTTDDRLKHFTHSLNGERYPQRFLYVKLQKYISDFLNKKSPNRMVVIPGFRGVGKTTLMAQICSEFKKRDLQVLFLSVEDLRNYFDVGINEIMSAYEKIIGENLESVKKPILIFFDEVQTDPKWAITLKSLFERTSNIFFCSTGSSAIVLQSTPNIARRAIFEPMTPMCFGEYQMIKNKIYPTPGLKDKIRQAIYFSETAEDVYNNLSALEGQINGYWSKIDRNDIKKYLSYGTFPFALVMPDEISIYNNISLLLDKIIKQDMPILGSFDQDTLGAVKRIIFAIAENDVTSLSTLADKFNINRLTIANIFDVLEKAELLVKIPPHGSNMTIANKPNKYLFMSPAIRMSFFYFTGNENTYLTRQGKLLEDSIGAHLYREFILRSDGIIRYDSAQAGADFILQIGNTKKIVVEVGLGSKDKKQVINTMRKIKSDYGIIFSNSERKFDKETNIVSIPLDYYFLM